MRFASRLSPLLLLVVAACGTEPTQATTTGQASLRVVNAFPASVDVLIDGNASITGLAAGAIGMATPGSGSHIVVLRTASGALLSQSITSAAGATGTLAVVRAVDGSASVAILDDTNSVVPPGATKVRVLHLAPNAGTLQVYRTQPDFQQPVSWQVPFTYQTNPTSLSAPFYQSTVGSWEVRVWQSPGDASGWTSATLRVVIPLLSGEKKTVLILDNPGGGVRIELI